MGFTQPDSAPQRPGQMPALPGPGPEFPHTQANDPLYDVPPLQFNQDGLREVLAPERGGPLQGSGAVRDPNEGVVAPYSPGQLSPIYVDRINSPAADDIVSGTVAGAVAAAEARFLDYQQDIEPQGGAYGTLMALPPSSPLDPGVGSLGEAVPTGHYYDPPRDY